MTEENAQRRALELFERLSEDDHLRHRLHSSEPPAVLAALRRLEAADARARVSFPTEDEQERSTGPSALPQRAGRYRLTRLLGHGGMGMVFAGERADGLFTHEVAVKLLHPHRFTDPALRRFDRERAILARLNHPFIARLIDGGVTDDGWPFIIMEKIEGAVIDAYVQAARLPLRQSVILLAQVCSAVEAAHAALVVHGDIKPDNILVGGDGTPRLLDFGVARLATHTEGAGGLEPRTVAYSAPERLMGAAPTVASDLYALGVLSRTVLGSRERSSRPALRDPDLEAIVSKATAEESGSRYRSAEALRLDFGRWLDRLPVAARKPSFGYVLLRLLDRNRLAAAVGSAFLFGLVLALVVAAAGWRRAAARAQDLDALAQYQLVILDQRLAALPQTVALRTELAREAQGYLERLAREGAETQRRLRAADGLRRLALLQGALDRPSLGDPVVAQATFTKALALVDNLADPDARRLRSEILVDAAHVASGAADPKTASQRLGGVDVTGSPPLLAARYWLGRSEVAQWDGAFDKAVEYAKRARGELSLAAASVDRNLLTIESQDLEGEALYYAGRLKASLQAYGSAENLAIRLERQFPSDGRARWKAARERWSLGTTLVEAGQPEQAAPLLRSALASAQKDAKTDPADRITARRARTFTLALGQALTRSGRVREGLTLLRSSVSQRWDSWRDHPGDPNGRRDWTTGLAALGDALLEQRRTHEACALYAEARSSVVNLGRERAITALEKGAGLAALNAQWSRTCRAATA